MNLDRNAFALVREIQRGTPAFVLEALREVQATAMLRARSTVVVPVSEPGRPFLWTEPRDGINQLLVDSRLPYAARLYATFHTVALHDLRGRPPITAHVAAYLGVVNLQDCARKGGAFEARKRAVLLGVKGLFEEYDADYIADSARRVRDMLTITPAKQSQELGSRRSKARYLLEAGRLALSHRMYSKAARSLKTCIDAAERVGDADTAAFARLNLALVDRAQDRMCEARAKLLDLVAALEGTGLDEALGSAYHELFALAVEQGEHTAAAEFLQKAAGAYPDDCPRRELLFYDAGVHWLEQGYASRALRFLSFLVPRFTVPAHRMIGLATWARAAAVAGDFRSYETLWPSAEAAITRGKRAPATAHALVQLAIAHLTAGRADRSRAAAKQAEQIASEAGEAGSAREAREWLAAADLGRPIQWREPPVQPSVDAFAERVSRSLALAQAV